MPNLKLPKLSEINVVRPILWKLARKITLATQMKTQNVLSGTSMQVSLDINHKVTFNKLRLHCC